MPVIHDNWKIRMRTRALLGTAGAATAALVAALLVSPGSASADTGTPCKAEFEVTLTPGPSLTPTTGTYTAGGQTGSIICEGTVDGKQITGPGTYGEVGRFGIARKYSCLDAEGDAEQTTTMVLPTADGPVKIVDNPTNSKFGPLQGGGVIGGTFSGPRLSGTFTIALVEGNCVTSPLTKVRVSMQGILVDKS